MGMGGSDGCRNDILLIVWEYDILAVLLGGLWASILLLGGLWASKAGSRCMKTTIRSYISSPSTSGNDPRLSYIWRYVSWDRYRDTYLDIWVRRVIIIIDIVMDHILILDIPVMFPVGHLYDSRDSSYAVSYTHLTLPTIYSV